MSAGSISPRPRRHCRPGARAAVLRGSVGSRPRLAVAETGKTAGAGAGAAFYPSNQTAGQRLFGSRLLASQTPAIIKTFHIFNTFAQIQTARQLSTFYRAWAWGSRGPLPTRGPASSSYGGKAVST